MISLHHHTHNRFSLYGINHFVEKFGIPIDVNGPHKQGISISYGEPVAPGNFKIQIEENEILDRLCGNISNPSGTLYLCEVPHETGYGEEVLAFFQTDSARYPCVVRDSEGIHIGVDIFRETGYLLSGHLDTIRPLLAKHIQDEIANQPTVDFLENILFDSIVSGFHQLNIPLVQKSFWPEGKSFAVCLTHDVDEIKKTYQWLSRPVKYLARKDFLKLKGQIKSLIQKIKGIEPYYTYNDIIRIENELEAKSTYFILKETGKVSPLSKKTWYLYGRNRSLQSPEIQALIQKLILNGDEVAIHGSYFSFKNPRLLREEVQELEQLIHKKVLGTRQHNLNLEIPATWDYQIGAGLKYDTTLGFKETIGFRWGTSFPFYPNFPENRMPLLEIPLIIMDICLESRGSKESDCLRIAYEVEQYHGVLNLLWHPPVFNELEYGDLRDTYIKINKQCKTAGAWIARACDIYQWILDRDQNPITYEFETSEKILKIFTNLNTKEQYLTLYLPPQTKCDSMPQNAQIIKTEGDCIFIKTLSSKNEREILVRLVNI